MAEWVVGRIPVLECLRARKRRPHRLYLLEGAKGLDAIREAAGGVPIEERPRRELDQMLPDTTHQGVALKADPLPIHHSDNWSSRDFAPDAVVVALDEIEDPHNFGAIVRSAAACGAVGVLFGKHRSAPISPASMKAAAGAMEYIDLVQATNLVRALEDMKEAGFWVAGLDADAPQLLWDANLSGRIVLVVGSEGKGIRRLVNETCDLRLRIPLQGPITSLNASVSAAIALAECLRQRTK
jgi:23S rRNA (guanosine2251-2'-O)-methyltransferase